MIVTETIKINGKSYKHTYSDQGKMIRKAKTGELYESAYDTDAYEYEETEIVKASLPEDDAESLKARIVELEAENILLRTTLNGGR